MPITEQSVEEEIMKDVSADLDVPYSTVREVVINGQSAFTKHVMESGQYNGVRWPFFGSFRVKAQSVQVKKYMRGLPEMYRIILRYRIKEGHVFPDKWNKAKVNETL